MKKKITIITPCYNEEANVIYCQEAVREIMTVHLPSYDYEHIFADNASTDATLEKLRAIAEKDKNVRVIANSRNVGPFRNMWNAMKSATGDAVIPLLPADLQDPPSVIPDFVKNWESGDLVVFGVRTKRQEPVFMRILRGIYYRTVKYFADAVIPINSGEFLLADIRVIKSILAVDDDYPYIRGLIAQTKVRSSSIRYTWVRRDRGRSKNSWIDLIDQAINGFVSTSRAPARLALLFGFVISILGLLGALLTFIIMLNDRDGISAGIPTIIVAIFLFGGIQLFFFGLIGEYVLSIHSQVRRRPPMFEVEKINFSDG